jgi:hypothetical protein
VKPREIGGHGRYFVRASRGHRSWPGTERGTGGGGSGRKGSKLSVIAELALIEALLQPNRCLVIPWEYLLYSNGA